jgi:predicted ATPase
VEAERGLTPFVGRDRELRTLGECFAQAQAGHGQVVFLVGEPGIGKSRLLLEFRQRLGDAEATWLEGHAMSFGQSIVFYPLIDLLKRNFRIEDGDPEATIVEKIEQGVLRLGADLHPILPYLRYLLAVDPGDPTVSTMDPQLRRGEIFAALRRLLLRAAEVRPQILVFEDLHWMDKATEASLAFIADSIPASRVLCLLTYRPGYAHPFGDRTYHTRLALTTLSTADSVQIAQAMLSATSLPAPLEALIVQKAEGNPFFVEEVVKSLQEVGAIRRSEDRHVLAKPLEEIVVPDTIQDVLMARIDRLQEAPKRTLQLAAVIGREFTHRLLDRLADIRERTEVYLQELKAIELIYEKRLFPEIAYTFKHALTQQVAYETLLQERRRALHARIVEALEARTGNGVAEQVERLAHHAVRGAVWDKALTYCRQAGERAMARSAHREAVGHFDHALSVLTSLPAQRDTHEQAIDLRLALRSALMPSSDSARILTCLHEAEALAGVLDDHHRLGQISGFLSVHFRNRGAYDQAIIAAQRTLALATADGDGVLHALANLYLGAAYWAEGAYARAIDCCRETVASLHGPQRLERFGQVTLPEAQAGAFLAVCYAELGRFAAGKAFGDDGVQIAEAVTHPSSLMWSCYRIGLLGLRQGDLPRALPLLERAMGICQEADLPLFVPRMAAALGTAYTLAGRASMP